MKLTNEEGRRIICEDHDDWIPVEGADIIETNRWTILVSQVFQHKPSGEHYQLYWRQGATEEQDEQPFEFDAPEPIKVVAKEVTTTRWEPANG
jgi:hypothetical protein